MAILTPEQKTTLLALIEANGLSQEPDNDIVANRLKVPAVVQGQARRVKVHPGEIQRKVYELGKMFPLIQLTKNPSFADLATTALGFLNSPQLPPVDVDAPAFGQMLAGLKQASVVTDADIAAILALADVTDPPSDGPSLFAVAFPDFTYVVDGVRYDRPTAALIAEARS